MKGAEEGDQAIAGEPETVVIRAADFYGNEAEASLVGGFTVEIVINGAVQQVAPVTYKGAATYTADYTENMVRQCELDDIMLTPR